MPDQKSAIDNIFHALGDPTRRAMVERLSAGPVSVSQLAEPLQMSLAAVVQHLQILEESGLVRTEKTGRVRTCRIDPKGLDAMQRWIDARRSHWEKGLSRLGDFLAETVDSPQHEAATKPPMASTRKK
jgi:DNA-binding transcriptional ArsR family regulator